MALEILTTVSSNQLVAAAVAALLSMAQLDELLSNSPVVLHHAVKQLQNILAQQV